MDFKFIQIKKGFFGCGKLFTYNIYYFTNYYSIEYLEAVSDLPYIDNLKKQSALIWNLKKLGTNSYFKENDPRKYYGKCLYDFFQHIEEPFILCTIPSHDQVGFFVNNMTHLLDSVKLPYLCTRNDALIIRTKVTEAKHKKTGKRNPLEDLDSLEFNSKFEVRGKLVIVVDDVTTSGASLNCAKYLLMNAGAKDVYCLAMAKTHDWQKYW